jgi:hypothetical protein
MDGLGQPVCLHQNYAPDNPNGMARHPISRNEGAITWARRGQGRHHRLDGFGEGYPRRAHVIGLLPTG